MEIVKLSFTKEILLDGALSVNVSVIDRLGAFSPALQFLGRRNGMHIVSQPAFVSQYNPSSH